MASTSCNAPSSNITSSSSKSGTKRKRDKADELFEKFSKTPDNKDDKFDIIERHTAYANLLSSHTNNLQLFKSSVFIASVWGKWFISSKRRVEPRTDKTTKKNEVYEAFK
ncbi:hypothetical protein HHI36_014549 [Cryptolaemus montrouzieri]|uniref:Uncharacterized protein n=1 Tax=Cryptolaemus montrouzieri TaxID=559131 RepID=A0ABD2N3V3_9CUCU